jgi:CRP-like cAMP-binding protein
MSNKDDLLGDLLGSKSTRKTGTGSPLSDIDNTDKGDKPKLGMTSLDLLSLPEDHRKIVNWLSRKKQSTFQEIQEGVNQPAQEVQRVLKELRDNNSIVQAMVNDEMVYRIVFRSATRKKANGLLGELWARVDMDNTSFLKQHPLFQDLNEEQLKDVVSKLEERTYSRDEVILLQGEISESLYMIKSGVVGISRFTQSKEKKNFTYLKESDILGENNVLLRQGGAATATATALSSVTLLAIKKDDFNLLLNAHPAIAVELARLLVQRLIATNTRFQNTSGAKLCVIIGIGTDVGATSIGAIMAMTLAQTTRKNTVYTELPNPDRLTTRLGLPEETDKYHHPGNFDILLAQDSPGLPLSLRATLAFDRLVSQYETIVVGLTAQHEEVVTYFAENADQLIIVTSPEPEKWDEFSKLTARLRNIIHPERVAVFHILNRVKPEHKTAEIQGRIDFDLPFDENMIAWPDMRLDHRPQVLSMMATSLADRLGRANQVSVYIPTTIDVDRAVDTSSYVQRTLAFLGERFGGATTNQARGVWNSNDAGLVGEDIHIVRSYATQDALDQHLHAILEFVEGLKVELRQEAMAVEINQKLMLI